MTDESSQIEPRTTVPTSPKGAAPEPDPGPADVLVQRRAIGAVEAGEVTVSVGAIGAARAERVSVELGAVGAVAGREVRVSQAGVGAVAALEAHFEQAVVRSVIARDVHFGRLSGAGVVIAARVDGDARVLVDWRGGLAAGTVLGLVWLVLRRLR